MANAKALFGTWRLISLKFQFSGSAQSADMYGADPMGSLILTPDFQMSTVITARHHGSTDGAAAQAALFGAMMAYSGPFQLEGADRFVTRVEVAWHPDWIGTEQARTYTLDGDTLLITTAEVSHPMFGGQKGRGVLKWVRA